MKQLTINNIVRLFAATQAAATGELLKSFRYGAIEEIDQSATDLFPMLFLEYPFNTKYSFKDNNLSKSVSFSLLVLDRFSEQDERDKTQGNPAILDIIGKSEQTLEQLLALLHKQIYDCNFVIDQPEAFTLSREFSDQLAGVQCGMSILGPSPYGVCAPIFADVDLCTANVQPSECYVY